MTKTSVLPEVRVFEGFSHPDDEGFTRIPNDWFEVCAQIDSLAELKIVLYMMRHTWVYQEYSSWKKITIDEFAHGRKRQDGTRMDSGTGLGITAVKDGIRRAVKHGYLVAGFDRSDLARIQKYYYLKMRKAES